MLWLHTTIFWRWIKPINMDHLTNLIVFWGFILQPRVGCLSAHHPLMPEHKEAGAAENDPSKRYWPTQAAPALLYNCLAALSVCRSWPAQLIVSSVWSRQTGFLSAAPWPAVVTNIMFIWQLSPGQRHNGPHLFTPSTMSREGEPKYFLDSS